MAHNHKITGSNPVSATNKLFEDRKAAIALLQPIKRKTIGLDVGDAVLPNN